MTGQLTIEIWSDVACPWCYVGKRHLEQAFEQRPDLTPSITWHAFQLDPSAPNERHGSHAEYLAHKYSLPAARGQQMIDQMVERGRAVGIDFDYAKLRTGNTFLAHQLLCLAKHRGVQAALKERLLKAHFSEGVLMSDLDALIRLAVEMGLDEAEVHDALQSGLYADEVRADQAMAQRLGITGVPFYVIGQYAMSGAQPPAAFLQVLARAQEEAEAAPAVALDGATCDPASGCEVAPE